MEMVVYLPSVTYLPAKQAAMLLLLLWRRDFVLT